MLKLGFLASNNGSAMRAIVDAALDRRLKAEPLLLVSNKDETGAVKFARERGIKVQIIPTLPNPDEADRKICDALMSANVEIVILSGYLRKLGERTLNHFNGRILNTHPALLPKFGGKGMYGRRVHEAVWAAKERETGATIHVADGEYDHGRILAQHVVPLRDDMDVERIESLVMAAEQSLLLETLIQIQSGQLRL